MAKYTEYIARYYASPVDIPKGHYDGEILTELIRCRDCKLYYPIENHKHGHCALYNFTHTDEDDYCSSAEREEE